VIVLAIVLGMVLLFRGLSPENELVISDGEDARSTTSTTSDRNAPPVTDLTPTTLPAPAPSEVIVLVANGSGVPGVGASTTVALTGKGYQTLDPTNTAADTPTSRVYFVPGSQAAAEEVATTLGLPTASVAALGDAPPVADVGTAMVLVVIGTNFPGLSAE
jgi:hypothetical protein